MNVSQLAKELDRDWRELAEELGLSSHLNKVDDSVVDQMLKPLPIIEHETVTETAPPIQEETVVFEEAKEVDDECPVDLKTLELHHRCLGSKSKYFKWIHLLNG